MFDANKDGIDHINIYSKGKTHLGLFLSNWYRHPIALPNLGTFQSIEGLWYYLSTQDERLRSAYGYEAKRLGLEILKSKSKSNEPAFKEIIKAAVKIKIQTSAEWFEFIKSDLPFTHYYVFADKVVDAGNKWLIDYIEELRQEFKSKLDISNKFK